jgi:hypothetical protein
VGERLHTIEEAILKKAILRIGLEILRGGPAKLRERRFGLFSAMAANS